MIQKLIIAVAAVAGAMPFAACAAPGTATPGQVVADQLGRGAPLYAQTGSTARRLIYEDQRGHSVSVDFSP